MAIERNIVLGLVICLLTIGLAQVYASNLYPTRNDDELDGDYYSEIMGSGSPRMKSRSVSTTSFTPTSVIQEIFSQPKLIGGSLAPYQDTATAETSYGHSGHGGGHGGWGSGKHGGGGGGGYGVTSKIKSGDCSSALGLLGVVGLATYLQTTMTNATNRKKRSAIIDTIDEKGLQSLISSMIPVMKMLDRTRRGIIRSPRDRSVKKGMGTGQRKKLNRNNSHKRHPVTLTRIY